MSDHNCQQEFQIAQTTLWAGYNVTITDDPQAIYNWTCSCGKHYFVDVVKSDYDWDHIPMQDAELAAILAEVGENSVLYDATQRLIEIYKEMRGDVAEGQVPDAFRPTLEDLIEDEN